MKGSLGIWSSVVGHDWGGLKNLAEWGKSICDKGGIVLKSGDLALGTDHDRSLDCGGLMPCLELRRNVDSSFCA